MSLIVQSSDNAIRLMQLQFNEANAQITISLQRLTTGKRFSQASEDIDSYISVAQYRSQEASYYTHQVNLEKSSGKLDLMINLANIVMSDLKEMKNAWNESETSEAGSLDQQAAQQKAQGIGDSIATAVATELDGKQMIATGTLASVIDIDGTLLDLTFSVAAPNTLPTGNESTSAETQLSMNGLLELIVQASGYKVRIDSNSRMANAMVQSFQSLQNSITSIDVAKETLNYVENDIKQQSALSILSQSMLSRQNIISLYSSDMFSFNTINPPELF